MRMLDLFSGIGGFSLAAEWVWGDELEIVGFCEIEKYAQKVLQKNFPGVPIYEDITELNGKDFKNIDLITGGFPCQDISVAGKGAGIEGSRSSLWFEMHRIIGEVRPSFALIENVPMLVIRGGTRVIADLAEIGYDSEWTIIGADDLNPPAWHRRKRFWCVCYPSNPETIPLDSNSTIAGSHREEVQFHGEAELRNQQVSDTGSVGAGVSRSGSNEEKTGRDENLAHAKGKQSREQTKSKGRKSISRRSGNSRGDQEKGGKETRKVSHPHSIGEKRDQSQDRQGIGAEQTRQDIPDTNSSRKTPSRNNRRVGWQRKPIKNARKYECENWLTEPNVGRVAYGIPYRVDRLKGLGNAIVPQVAKVIMERIKNDTNS